MSNIFEEKQDEEDLNNNNPQEDVATEGNNTFGTISKFKAPPTIVTTVLSKEELDNLKKTKPSNYLKLTIMHGKVWETSVSAL